VTYENYKSLWEGNSVSPLRIPPLPPQHVMVWTKSRNRCIIADDLNLHIVDWNANAESANISQPFINRLVWENGCTAIVNGPTRRDAFC
jgi:hypothetical protein